MNLSQQIHAEVLSGTTRGSRSETQHGVNH